MRLIAVLLVRILGHEGLELRGPELASYTRKNKARRTSDASDTLILHNQPRGPESEIQADIRNPCAFANSPSPSGDLFNRLGEPESSSLTASTVPDTGAYYATITLSTVWT